MAIQSEPSTQARLAVIASELDPEPLHQLLDFAEYLKFKQWEAEHDAIGMASLAEAYGDDEPDYTNAPTRTR